METIIHVNEVTEEVKDLIKDLKDKLKQQNPAIKLKMKKD